MAGPSAEAVALGEAALAILGGRGEQFEQSYLLMQTGLALKRDSVTRSV